MNRHAHPPSNVYWAAESPRQTPYASSKDFTTSSFVNCSPCDHEKEGSPECNCRNPIKGIMYITHRSLSKIQNLAKHLSVKNVSEVLQSPLAE
ncbi:hypothetical protein YC2023_054512 [Brassica napus]